MTDSVTVELERDPAPEAGALIPVAEDAHGIISSTAIRQRFTCGQGCGFVVNVN